MLPTCNAMGVGSERGAIMMTDCTAFIRSHSQPHSSIPFGSLDHDELTRRFDTRYSQPRSEMLSCWLISQY